MNIKTLIHIYILLKADLEEKEQLLDDIKERLDVAAEASYPTSWHESEELAVAVDEYNAAREALKDFENTAWVIGGKETR